MDNTPTAEYTKYDGAIKAGLVGITAALAVTVGGTLLSEASQRSLVRGFNLISSDPPATTVVSSKGDITKNWAKPVMIDGKAYSVSQTTYKTTCDFSLVSLEARRPGQKTITVGEIKETPCP